MGKSEFIYKVKYKLRKKFIIDKFNKIPYLKYCNKYLSYRFMIRSKNLSNDFSDLYLTARPNPGAGIGHQIANWNAGFWFASYFGLKFAHTPFSNISVPFQKNDWDEFLGFDNGEVLASDLIKKGWKKILLPLFDENSLNQVKIIKQIIKAYAGKKILFVLEQDQFYKQQFGVMENLQKKFHSVHSESGEKLLFNKDEFNIAIHVRRGDIVQNDGEDNPNLTMRWLTNNYFTNALDYVLNLNLSVKPTHIYLFSQGSISDYPEFNNYKNLTFCINMDPKETFLNMVFADVLITSKSSFSYKPALLNKNLKVCPADFWHDYPNSQDWVLLTNEGAILKRSI